MKRKAKTPQHMQRNYNALYGVLKDDLEAIRALVDEALPGGDAAKKQVTVERVRELADELRAYKQAMIQVRVVVEGALGERQGKQTVLQRVEALAKAHQNVGSALRAQVA